MKESKIRVLLVEDHEIVREGLKMVLELEADIQIVGESGDGRDIKQLIESAFPDIVLLDLELPYIRGTAVCKSIKRLWPEIKVLILTAYMDDEALIEAIRSGADGYVLKGIEKDSLVNAIRDTMDGKGSIHPDMVASVFNRIRKEDSRLFGELTPMEERILEKISEGMTNKEIAISLDLAEKTVRNYCSLLFKKIGVENRTEAANCYNNRKRT